MTALHIAVHHRHTAVVKEIVKGRDKEVLNARDHVSFIHTRYRYSPVIMRTSLIGT